MWRTIRPFEVSNRVNLDALGDCCRFAAHLKGASPHGDGMGAHVIGGTHMTSEALRKRGQMQGVGLEHFGGELSIASGHATFITTNRLRGAMQRTALCDLRLASPLACKPNALRRCGTVSAMGEWGESPCFGIASPFAAKLGLWSMRTLRVADTTKHLVNMIFVFSPALPRFSGAYPCASSRIP